MTDYKKVLKIATTILMTMKIDFKFVTTLEFVKKFNSDDISMGSSGKLITIYPVSVSETEKAMEALSSALSDFIGSEVLTDIPFDDSHIVFFRFGPHGTTSKVLYGPNNEKFVDTREPVFRTPSWINIPFKSRQRRTGTQLQQKYHMLGIIKRSNMGNVYLAEYKLQPGRQVVIKEARRNILAPGNVLKTKLRNQEFKVAMDLVHKHLDFISHPIETIHENYSDFYVYSYIDNPELSSLVGQISPTFDKNRLNNLQTVCEIIVSLISNVKEIHKFGYENIDISSRNVAWDGLQTYLFDFDSLHEFGRSTFCKTEGYWSNQMNRNTNMLRDFQRVAFAFFFLFGNQNRVLYKNDVEQIIFSNIARTLVQAGISADIIVPISRIYYMKDTSEVKTIEREISSYINYLDNYISTDNYNNRRTDVTNEIENLIRSCTITSNLTIGDTNLCPFDESNENGIKQVNNLDFRLLSTGLTGLGGILIYLRNDMDRVSAVDIIHKVISEANSRLVVFHNKSGLIQSHAKGRVISPYLDKGVAGFVFAMLENGIAYSLFSDELNKLTEGLEESCAKTGGILGGLSGLTLVLILDDSYHNSHSHQEIVKTQVETGINLTIFNSKNPTMFNYQTGSMDSSEEFGFKGYLETCDIALKYYPFVS